MEQSGGLILVILVVLGLNMKVTLGQRVAPGVPPQYYQPNDPNQQQFGQGHPPPPPQHYQQQQFVQQHVPGVPPPQQQQFQQPPPIQGQQLQQQIAGVGQQQQPQGGHGHDHGHGHNAGVGGHQQAFSGHAQQPLLDTSNIGLERQHIQEHMAVPIDTSQMSEQELQFHYFKMYDADNNNKLDGCELVKTLFHWHDTANHDHSGGQTVPEPKVFSDEELINTIDPILKDHDKNGDGYIDYAEFSLAQAAAAANKAKENTA